MARPFWTLPPLADLGALVGHRLLLGDDVRQDLVLDLDRAGGVAGLLLGLGGHGGDVVAAGSGASCPALAISDRPP